MAISLLMLGGSSCDVFYYFQNEVDFAMLSFSVSYHQTGSHSELWIRKNYQNVRVATAIALLISGDSNSDTVRTQSILLLSHFSAE